MQVCVSSAYMPKTFNVFFNLKQREAVVRESGKELGYIPYKRMSTWIIIVALYLQATLKSDLKKKYFSGMVPSCVVPLCRWGEGTNPDNVVDNMKICFLNLDRLCFSLRLCREQREGDVQTGRLPEGPEAGEVHPDVLRWLPDDGGEVPAQRPPLPGHGLYRPQGGPQRHPQRECLPGELVVFHVLHVGDVRDVYMYTQIDTLRCVAVLVNSIIFIIWPNTVKTKVAMHFLMRS